MYEGFLVDMYVVVVSIIALISLYVVSNPTTMQSVIKKRTGSIIPLLHGNSRIKQCTVQRSKNVLIAVTSDGKKIYTKKHML